MRIITTSILLIYALPCFSQSDSVYLSIRNGLIPEYEIIFPKGENSIRENYTGFKGVLWIGKTDNISLNEWLLSNQNISKKEQRKTTISKHVLCDSLINEIRNKGYYHKMINEISEFSGLEIANSQEFLDYQKGNGLIVRDFISQCFTEFSEEMGAYKNKMFAEIKRIKKSKVDRFEKMKSNPSSIGEDEISSLIQTFARCEPDFRSFEIIVLNKTEDFMHAIVYTVNQNTFDLFCNKLYNFPKDIDISQLMKKIKTFNSESPRKKQLIKSLKRKR